MKNFIAFLAVLIITVGCASQPRIDTDLDTSYNLSDYKSFAIENPSLEDNPSQISINPILMQRLARSLEASLVKRGFVKSSEPDMVVRFFIATEREVERSRSYGSWYRRGYFNDMDQRFSWVDKDALAIRFHDAKSDEVFWYAFSRFNRSLTPKDQAKVDTLVEKAISKFNSGP